MSQDWATLDQKTRWSQGAASPFVMHQEPYRLRGHPGATCRVEAHAGKIAPGTDDIFVQVVTPNATQGFTIAWLLEDVRRKSNAYPSWATTELALAMIRVVVFEEDPQATVRSSPVGLPGFPLVSFLCMMQGLSLSEFRKFPGASSSSGRYLPVRLAMGVMYGRWSQTDIPQSLLMSRTNPLPILRDQRGREPSFEDVLIATAFVTPPGLTVKQRNSLTA